MRTGNRFTRSAADQTKKRALPLHVQTSNRSKRASTRNRLKQSISKNDSLQRTSNTQTHSPSSQQTSSQTEEQTKPIKSALPQHVSNIERSKRPSTSNFSKESISKNDSLQRTSNTQTHSPSSPQSSKINEQQQFEKKQSETFIDKHKEKVQHTLVQKESITQKDHEQQSNQKPLFITKLDQFEKIDFDTYTVTDIHELCSLNQISYKDSTGKNSLIAMISEHIDSLDGKKNFKFFLKKGKPIDECQHTLVPKETII